jgi:serine protease AprX
MSQRAAQTSKRPLLMCGLLLLCAEAAPAAEVLCERTRFAQVLPDKPQITARNAEREGDPGSVYRLSALAVPPGGWQIETVTIYTAKPRKPRGWLQVNRARLNLFRKNGELPAPADDPRDGKIVPVTVRQVGDVFEVRAVGLKLDLPSAEYWFGLTPIIRFADNSEAFHLVACEVRDARTDDVLCSPDGDGGSQPEKRNWTPMGPKVYEILFGHLSIKIEGRRLPRGRLTTAPLPPEHDGPKRLFLRFGTFDPLTEETKVPPELAALPNGHVWVVQWKQVVDQASRDQLAQAGATLLRYLPDDAYIVSMPPAGAERIRQLKGVRWVGPYHPAYRIDPNVFPERFDNKPSPPEPAKEPQGRRHLFVHLFERDSGAKATAAAAIRAAGGGVLYTSPHGYYLAAEIPFDKLAGVAGCDAVCGFERRFDGRRANQGPSSDDKCLTLAQVRELCGANAVEKAGGYQGLGVRAVVMDNGVRADHIDLLSRPITFTGPIQPSDARHGTPIAGILCGDGRGDARARGLLPLGSLVFHPMQSHYENHYALTKLWTEEERAVVRSDSGTDWTTAHFTRHYDGRALREDDLALEYDLLLCAAIGNEEKPGLGNPGSWSKNAVIVGGADSYGSVHRKNHHPWAASTTGPALDGRIKPDLVHFADGVYSPSPISTRSYGNMNGTSAATPLVAGHFGLLFEMWADNVFGTLPRGRSVFDRKPHAATAKALMINSAYRYPIADGPKGFTRFSQGWGMPDLKALYDCRNTLFIVDQDISLRDHQSIEYRLRVAEGQPAFRATLAYSDPPGITSAAKALVNDLDLTVTAPDGARYHGNNGLLEGNISQPGGTPDRLNNVENVFLDDPQPGVYRVQVSAHRVGWGQRAASSPWGQDFALVVSGVAPNPLPVEP